MCIYRSSLACDKIKMQHLVHFFLLLFTAAPCFSAKDCDVYPRKDPCQPGGLWDPVLERCAGIDSAPCYQCYSGQYCDTKEDPLQCKLSSSSGNPVYLAEYWTEGMSVMGEPCTRTPQHYRPAYQFHHYSSVVEENIFPPLKDAILELHQKTGNAETSGHSIVTGMGATMVLYSAVSVLAQRILEECRNTSNSCPSEVDLFVQVPHYVGYIDIASHAPNVRWNSSADVNSPFTIEIVTYPNNPSGEKRDPLVKDPSRVIMDMVYYWPMYTEINVKMNHSLMVFSSSKHGGLAGTRFGWGFVQDKAVADAMIEVIGGIMLSYSVDVQLRVLSGLKVVLEEANHTADSTFPYHQFGHRVIYGRFKQVSDLLTTCPGFSLFNQLLSTGAYAWISCSSDFGSCEDMLEKVNLYGLPGSVFGATNHYVRLSMLMPSVEFDTLLYKLKALCSNLSFHRLT